MIKEHFENATAAIDRRATYTKDRDFSIIMMYTTALNENPCKLLKLMHSEKDQYYDDENEPVVQTATPITNSTVPEYENVKNFKRNS